MKAEVGCRGRGSKRRKYTLREKRKETENKHTLDKERREKRKREGSTGQQKREGRGSVEGKRDPKRRKKERGRGRG